MPIKIALSTFARAEIEARLGPDVAAGVRTALLHYASCAGAGRASLELPRFRCSEPPRASDCGFDLAIDPEVERILEEQTRVLKGAPSQEQLAAHAVLVYLADLDEAADRDGQASAGR